MIDEDKWMEQSFRHFELDMLAQLEQRLVTEFQYLADEKKENREADLPAARHEAAGSD